MYPKLVRSLVTYEPVLFRWLFDDIDHQQLGKASSQSRTRCEIGSRRSGAFGGATIHRFLVRRRRVGFIASGKQTSIAARMRAVFNNSTHCFASRFSVRELARLRMPMMFVSGVAHRRCHTSHRCSSARGLPDAEHQSPGNGHMGPITHATEFNRRVVRFLDTQREYSRPAPEAFSAAA